MEVLEKILSNIRIIHDNECRELEPGIYILLRASSAFYMNDKLEYQMMPHHLQEKFDSILKKYVNYIDGEPFIISFSNVKDSIPMWLNYAKQGKGVCLEFDKKKLINWVEQWKQDNINNYNIEINSGNCNYEHMDNNNDVIIEEEDNNRMDTVRQYSSLLIKYAFHKHPSFKYEDEWRILIRNNNPLKFYVKNEMIVPYEELPIPISCLSAIYIGANADFDKAQHSISLMLNPYISRYKIDIIKSENPLQ